MNGEQIVKEIDTRLTKLEVKFEERWISYDKQTKEHQETICQKLDIVSGNIKDFEKRLISQDTISNILSRDMDKRINNLPCLTHIEQIKSLNKGINWIWSVVLSTIFGSVLLGIWIKKM